MILSLPYMSKPFRIGSVEIDSLTSECIAFSVVEPHHSDKTIGCKTHTGEIVEDHELARINSFSFLHNLC